MYLEALNGKLEAIAGEIQSATEKLEAAAKARKEASAQVSRLQGLADEAAAAEEHSHGTLRAVEQVQTFLRQYRLVVGLGPVGVQPVNGRFRNNIDSGQYIGCRMLLHLRILHQEFDLYVL